MRNLQGVSYWIIEDPQSISDYINTNVRKEWELDVKEEGRNVDSDPWLKELSGRMWILKAARLNEIRLNPLVVNYRNSDKGYDFQAELSKRRALLRRSLEFGSVIWPIIVDEKMTLRDGYCRYTTLAEIGIPETYCFMATVRAPDLLVP